MVDWVLGFLCMVGTWFQEYTAMHNNFFLTYGLYFSFLLVKKKTLVSPNS